MTQWEYKIIRCNSPSAENDSRSSTVYQKAAEHEFNRLGNEGWEIIDIRPARSQWVVTLKRPRATAQA